MLEFIMTENDETSKLKSYDIMLDGKKIGYCEVCDDEEMLDGSCYIRTLEIVEGYRSKGYGTETVRHFSEGHWKTYMTDDNSEKEAFCKKIGTEVFWKSIPECLSAECDNFGTLYEVG